MSYHVMRASMRGFKPLLGTVYTGYSLRTLYNTATLQEPTPEQEWQASLDALEDMGVDPSDTEVEADGADGSLEEQEAADKQKMLLIAGGVGAVVLVAGVAILVARRK
jgi:hypothetical protein